jgi:aminoglycoside 3-N-acetyltransferase
MNGLRAQLLGAIPPGFKSELRTRVRNAKSAYRRWRYAFTQEDLLQALRKIGVHAGDCLMVHSSFASFEGFHGDATDAIAVLQKAVGDSGLLLMPTLPFSGSAIDYAALQKIFDPRTTPSSMGLLTEIFRRTDGVIRSLHPTHSVAIWGNDATEFIEAHPSVSTPCGEGSPYHRLLARQGKILLAGVDISTATFFHAVEGIIEPLMPFSPFTSETYTLRYRKAGQVLETAPMRLFTKSAPRRDLYKLIPVLKADGKWHETQVGGLSLILFQASDMLDAVRSLAFKRIFCYETY